MREILFRGKSTSTNKWVYGGYEELKDVNEHIIYQAESYVHIQPETRGQYTGLKDKNGVKIFEDDIVRCEGCIDKVVWRGAAFNVGEDYLDFLVGTDIEVIGNIHDNPELLEGRK
jgi:uncharacterized phage protein (TIGR01671 family)